MWPWASHITLRSLSRIRCCRRSPAASLGIFCACGAESRLPHRPLRFRAARAIPILLRVAVYSIWSVHRVSDRSVIHLSPIHRYPCAPLKSCGFSGMARNQTLAEFWHQNLWQPVSNLVFEIISISNYLNIFRLKLYNLNNLIYKGLFIFNLTEFNLFVPSM